MVCLVKINKYALIQTSFNLQHTQVLGILLGQHVLVSVLCTRIWRAMISWIAIKSRQHILLVSYQNNSIKDIYENGKSVWWYLFYVFF